MGTFWSRYSNQTRPENTKSKCLILNAVVLKDLSTLSLTFSILSKEYGGLTSTSLGSQSFAVFHYQPFSIFCVDFEFDTVWLLFSSRQKNTKQILQEDFQASDTESGWNIKDAEKQKEKMKGP